MRVGHVHVEVTLDEDAPLLYDSPIDAEDLDMPEDVIKKLVGDGEARISVSAGLSDKDYGNGFSSQVTVSLTCDQNSDTIDDAFQIAKALSSEYTEQAYLEAGDLFIKKWRK